MPTIVYDVEFNIKAPKSGIGSSVKDINNAENLEKSLKGVGAQIKKNEEASESFNNEQKNTAKQIGRTNKSFSGANQAVFAFGDLVQDSTQFTQGFSQGMRAIGNNVSFAGELFGNLSSRVKEYNANLSDADRAAGKTKSVGNELKDSLTGIGGALIFVNIAFIAGQVLADGMRREYKKLEEQSKLNAEAFVEITDAMTSFDTGIPDPFGLRKTARETEMLQEKLGAFNEEVVKSALAQSVFTKFGQSASGLASLFGDFSLSLANYLGIGGEALQGTLIQTEALVELSKELEKSKFKQEAFNDELAKNAPLKAYVDLTKDTELVFAELSSGIELTEKNTRGLYIAIEEQNKAIATSNLEIDKKVTLLAMLAELQGIVATKEIQLWKEERETERLKASNWEIRERMKLIGENNVIRRAELQETIRNNAIEQSILVATAKVQDSLTMGTITGEQAKTRITEIETKKRLLLKESEMLKDQEIREQRRAALQALASETSALFGSLIALSQQNAQKSEEVAKKEFETQKKLRYGQAIISAASGIASAFTPYFPVISEARAALIAAATGVQIKTIKNTEFGSGGSVSSGGSSGARGIISTTDVAQPVNQITFMPNANNSSNSNITVQVNNTFDKKTVARVVKDGNTQIANSQKSVF